MLIKLRREKRAQSLVIVALSATALFGIIALGLDAGRLYFQRRDVQNAADAGALAGAQELLPNAADTIPTTAMIAFDWRPLERDVHGVRIRCRRSRQRRQLRPEWQRPDRRRLHRQRHLPAESGPGPPGVELEMAHAQPGWGLHAPQWAFLLFASVR